MILISMLVFISISCLMLSLFTLAVVKTRLSSSTEAYIETNSDDAILISGCDSGIGLELAKYFHRTSNLKIICCFLNTKDSDGYKRLKELTEDNLRLALQRVDLTSKDDVENLMIKLEKLKTEGFFKRLIGLVNNAGVMTYGEFDWLTWDHIQSQIDVNLTGTLRLTRAVVPYILESKGRIINVSSVNDTTVFPGLSVYAATKSAISTFSKGLGYELRKFGANVITIRLGDFARLTKIMAGHASNRDDMWSEMSPKKRQIYKDFFPEFNRHLLDNYGMTSPREFADSSLFQDFERALLARNPSTSITCAPLGFKIFYFVIELLPVRLQYLLLDILIRIGFRWKPPQVEL